MITLGANFILDNSEMNGAWSSASESTLRYECFIGDLCFIVGESDFSTDWEWTPIWDAALDIRHALELLWGGTAEVAGFEFTESEASIRFSRNADEITVAANYVEGIATCDFAELRRAAQLFVGNVSSRITAHYPELSQNPEFLGAFQNV